MFEAINTKNLVSLDELMSPDFIMHMNSKETKGWIANRRFIEEEFNAFPDLHVNIEDILAEGNLVCVRVTEAALIPMNIVESPLQEIG
jgi:predicted ester cyclase